jgi:hypothetical protein
MNSLLKTSLKGREAIEVAEEEAMTIIALVSIRRVFKRGMITQIMMIVGKTTNTKLILIMSQEVVVVEAVGKMIEILRNHL